MDPTIITIIPPVLASILTYLVAMRRSNIVRVKTLSDMQANSIELVQKAEEQMRLDLRKDIDEIKAENKALRDEVDNLKTQRNVSENVANLLKQEVNSLKTSVEAYKRIIDDNKIIMDSNRMEIEYLRKMADLALLKNRRRGDVIKKKPSKT